MLKVFLFFVFFISLSCSEGDIYSVELTTMDGQRTDLHSYKGERFLLYLWTGTCLGHVNDMREMIRSKGKLRMPVVSVAIMMKPEDIKEVLDDNGLDPWFPLYADPKGRMAEVITLEFLPTTVLVSEKGKVVKMIPGFSPSLR